MGVDLAEAAWTRFRERMTVFLDQAVRDAALGRSGGDLDWAEVITGEAMVMSKEGPRIYLAYIAELYREAQSETLNGWREDVFRRAGGAGPVPASEEVRLPRRAHLRAVPSMSEVEHDAVDGLSGRDV